MIKPREAIKKPLRGYLWEKMEAGASEIVVRVEERRLKYTQDLIDWIRV